MISDFLSTWDLFHYTYLTGSLISVLLSIVGVIVVARDQIFIGAAVSQASTLGIALAMWAGSIFAERGAEWIESEGFPAVMAVLFCMGAAFFTWRGGKPKRESYEAVTGWVFLFSASFSILVVSKSPHGLEEIYRLLSSNIIGATRTDVWIFSVVSLLTILFFVFKRERILLLAMDPEMAIAIGMNRKFWELAISLWLGLTVGISMRSSGMLYTFGCLVLPSLVAKNLCSEVGTMFYAAPAIAFMVSGFSFILANHFDLPPAQVTVALLSFSLAVAWIKTSFSS